MTPGSSYPVVKDLLLLGGGHSHVAVLKNFGMNPMPGVRLTLISREVHTPYSGMLPGLIAGHYEFDEAHIDLGPLARFAGARLLHDEVTGLDLEARRAICRDRPPVAYDVLSIDVGVTPRLDVPGAADNVVPVKPISGFLARWEELAQRVAARHGAGRIGVVGAGAGGVELLLAAQYRLHRRLAGNGANGRTPEFHLFADSEDILPAFPASVRQKFRRVLSERGVIVHTGAAVVQVGPGWLKTADGAAQDADDILWVTPGGAAGWLRDAGLAVDERGFVLVNEALQSVSHPEVFAAGDAALMQRHPRPRAGVFAVRQGKPLARNLRRALRARPLQPFAPQRAFLSLISTGDKYAIASRNGLAAEGKLVWRWKDRIDRQFVRQYSELPEMPQASGVRLAPGVADQAALGELATVAMRCGGCGAKIGAGVLARALQRLRPFVRDDVLIGLDAPDDAAVVALPPGKVAVHTVDYFRAFIDDPYRFGQVAANHALGDIFAMGAEPCTALAIATLPHGIEAKLEEQLFQLMAGALTVLQEARVALVGGHTSEGAELALGFAVNGTADPASLLRKGGLRAGDRLILTKPLGTGVLFAAEMRGKAKARWIDAALAAMTQSNAAGAAILRRHRASACTDVTGFGLVGHLVEMVRASGVDAELALAAVPLFDGAIETVRRGIFSSLQPQNIRLRRALRNAEEVSGDERFPLLFDPQTAGGLLAGVPADRAEAAISALREAGYAEAAIIGAVLARGDAPEPITFAALRAQPAPAAAEV